MAVQTFLCPSCKAGEFRSLPGPDGKAFCPWCGGAVESAPEAPPPEPEPPMTLESLKERAERAEAELARELDKRKGIKKVVAEELGKLESRLDETKVRLRKKEEEQGASFDEMLRLKAALEAERDKVAELSKSGASLPEKEKLIQDLRAELVSLRNVDLWLRDAREAAQGEAAKVAALQAERTELREKVAARDHLLSAMKGVESELAAHKAKLREESGRLAKERERASALEADLARRDQRIRELQALIKTLGERLNVLAQRHHL